MLKDGPRKTWAQTASCHGGCKGHRAHNDRLCGDPSGRCLAKLTSMDFTSRTCPASQPARSRMPTSSLEQNDIKMRYKTNTAKDSQKMFKCFESKGACDAGDLSVALHRLNTFYSVQLRQACCGHGRSCVEKDGDG